MKQIRAMCVALMIGVFSMMASADDDAPVYSAEVIREDFAQLYETLKAAHADLFVEVARADYDALYAEMRRQLDRPMHRDEVVWRFQEFVAFGRVAHARIDEAGALFDQHRGDGGKYLPLVPRIRNGKAFVSRYNGDALQPGDELLAVDGVAFRDLLKAMRRHQSADTDYLAHTMLEWQFSRLLWQLHPGQRHFRIRLRRDGEIREQVLSTATQDQLRQMAEARGDENRLELSWTEREFRRIDDDVAYLRPGPFYNVGDEGLWDTTAFISFIDDAFESLVERNTPALLIDVRDNPGGDAAFSDPMIAWFADRPFRFYSTFEVRVSQPAIEANAKRLASGNGGISRQYAREYARRESGETFQMEISMVEPRDAPRYQGEVYILINRHSFSNAATVAALVQDYDFATLLGEETADLATTLGAMEQFTLEHTGIAVGFPKARIVRPSGDETRRGVVPDVAIETPLVEPVDDPVLLEAVEIIRRST
ncbi:MAG: S41 family peptidase, partial [Wenzhouxiangellaceae bacterium]